MLRAATKYRRFSLQQQLAEAPTNDFGVSSVIGLLARLYLEG